MKHGHRGSPVAYAPLSPDVVRDLRERQQTYADQVRYWPCPSPPVKQRATGKPIPHHPLHIKTSESHPINVSHIIPPESLLAISSHLIPRRKPCAVLFDIHLPYALDRIAGYPQLSLSPPVLPVPIPHSPPNVLRPSISSVLNTALGTLPSSRLFLSLKRNLRIHSIHNQSSNPTDPSQPTHSLSPLTRPPIAPSASDVFPTPKSHRTRHQRQFRLGNLLLSSCPGKKVRLTGPVRGRSAVCRDLNVDLRRMKMMGARCVVCCLDDDELEFLVGMSWSEYRQVAHREGLDVLRIPLPEGLTPMSPKSLDADLDRIIETYTLRGTSVLVHCRGGVGRAGLFACCWMLKLGLCGSIETDDVPPPETFRCDSDTVVRRDTLQMVVRVIDVVRRRRSVKAIETLEQVQFLVEYVDYLRTCGRVTHDS